MYVAMLKSKCMKIFFARMKIVSWKSREIDFSRFQKWVFRFSRKKCDKVWQYNRVLWPSRKKEKKVWHVWQYNLALRRRSLKQEIMPPCILLTLFTSKLTRIKICTAYHCGIYIGISSGGRARAGRPVSFFSPFPLFTLTRSDPQCYRVSSRSPVPKWVWAAGWYHRRWAHCAWTHDSDKSDTVESQQ